jgi:RNA-directed DNA polymerase
MEERNAPAAQARDEQSVAWNKLPWRKLEQHVYRIQKRMCAMRRTEISLV